MANKIKEIVVDFIYKILQAVTFWDKAPCSLLSDYSGFERIYCLDLNVEVNMAAESFTETSLTTNKTERCHNTIEHVLKFTTVKASNLT